MSSRKASNTETKTNYTTINLLPTAPIVGTITQPTCALATGSVELSGLPATGGWTLTRTPGNVTTSGTGTITTLSGLAEGSYTYTIRNSEGCTSIASSPVIINAQPLTPNVPNQTASILSGATFTVTPTGSTIPIGTTYTWGTPTYIGGVTGGSAQAIPQANISETLTIPSGVGTAIYTVTPTSGACVGAIFNVTVTVISTCVQVTIGTQPSNSLMCATSGNASFTVVVSGTAPFTYQWQYYNGSTWTPVVNGTPSGSSYTNPTLSTFSVTGITTAGSYQYRCYITNCNGGNSATSSEATLTVNALPTATISDPITICKDAPNPSVTFTGVGGTPPYTFSYSVNDSAPISVTTSGENSSVDVDVPIETADIFDFRLWYVTDDNGCTSPFLNLGTVVRVASATVSTEDATIITSGSAKLNGTINANNFSADITFEYGLTPAYGSTIAASPATVTGTDNIAVSCHYFWAVVQYDLSLQS